MIQGMMILVVLLANIWMHEAAQKHNGGSIADASIPVILQ